MCMDGPCFVVLLLLVFCYVDSMFTINRAGHNIRLSILSSFQGSVLVAPRTNVLYTSYLLPPSL